MRYRTRWILAVVLCTVALVSSCTFTPDYRTGWADGHQTTHDGVRLTTDPVDPFDFGIAYFSGYLAGRFGPQSR